MDLSCDGGFVEVAERIWVRRHAQTPANTVDVNVCVVAGSRGLVVVDTTESDAGARGDIDRVRRLLGPGLEVVAVVNTHEHFDHVLGNPAWRAAYPGATIVAHDEAAAAIGDVDTTFSSVHVIDLGDRAVELVHPGKGHTAGDIVLRIDDADALLAGDLVEESGTPGFGDDCHPMSWPLSLDLVLGLIGPATVVVPGHGNPVDRAYVDEQRAAIGVVAETIRDLAGRGVPVDEALDAAEWPYPRERLADAVRRGYAGLPRSARHLPLI